MIRIAQPIIAEEEIKAVNDVLSSGMLAQGPKVVDLEAAFAKYCGTKYALTLNSGTAAIHCALFAAGIQPGDEVITTPFSFIATVNPILMLGAKPIFVDVESNTFNIDATKIEQAVTNKTRAILPVHLYGQPADMTKIQTIAKRRKLRIIEDACQAIGATYGNKKAGNLGDLGCFSLYATKNIMSGEGGVVTTNSQQQADAIRRFRQHGMNAQYQYEHIGYNYRMSDLHAAIALEQIKKVDDFNEARQKNANTLNKGLVGIPGIELPQLASDRTHVFHQYTIRIKKNFSMTRDELIKFLREREIISGVYYPKPLHFFPHIAKYGYKIGQFPNAELAAAEVLSLPIHPKVTQDDIKTIIAAFKDAV